MDELFLFFLAVVAYGLYVVFIGPVLAIVGAVAVFANVVAGTVAGVVRSARTVPTVTEREGDDPAYVSYFLGQGLADVRWTARSISSSIRDTSQWLTDLWDEQLGEPLLFTWPLVPGHIVGGVLGLFAVAAALLVQAIVALVGFVVAVVTSLVLRALDRVLATVRRVRTLCPHPGCNNPISYPGYRCPRCDAMHLNVRPGRYGVAMRTCRCGQRMPTLVLLGASHGNAACVHCLRPLEKSAGTIRELQVPVLGSTSAGKSGFLGATFNALVSDASGRVLSVRPADPSAPFVREIADRAANGMQLVPTERHIPAAMQLYLQPAKGREIAVHFFDPAGELLRGEEGALDELGFLAHADRFVFVLDPLALPSVTARFDPAQRRAADAAGPTGEDQEQTFHNSVQRIAGTAKKGRLAFVVTKVDVLAGTAAREALDGTSSASVEAWLEDHGMGNLVRAARNAFSEVTFYACSAPHPQGGPMMAPLMDPVAWLLDLKAPAGPSSGVARGATSATDRDGHAGGTDAIGAPGAADGALHTDEVEAGAEAGAGAGAS